MIWLFKIDDENTIWYDKPKVNEYHLFDTDDIMFDITKCGIDFQFNLGEYYILSDLDDSKIYLLRNTFYKNPYGMTPDIVGPEHIKRLLLAKEADVYTSIKQFYKEESRDIKLNKLLG